MCKISQLIYIYFSTTVLDLVPVEWQVCLYNPHKSLAWQGPATQTADRHPPVRAPVSFIKSYFPFSGCNREGSTHTHTHTHTHTLFFPYIKERMKTTIPISAEFTAMVMGHGLTRSYHHRIKIISNSMYPCGLKEEQRINHTILNCTQLERILQNAIFRTGDTWPPLFEQLTRKHIKMFMKFVRSTDFSAL